MNPENAENSPKKRSMHYEKKESVLVDEDGDFYNENQEEDDNLNDNENQNEKLPELISSESEPETDDREIPLVHRDSTFFGALLVLFVAMALGLYYGWKLHESEFKDEPK